ncbi:MAG: sulfurtransferase TusA family protein [Nitriliruptorales bacterium]
MTLDVRGRACPIPVIELAKAMRGAEIGDVVVVLADDPTAKVDVPVWCRMQRQRFRDQRELEDGGWAFEVEKIAELR